MLENLSRKLIEAQSVVDTLLNDVVDAVRLGRPVLTHAAVQGHDDVLRYLLQRLSSSDSSSSSSDLSAPCAQPEPLIKALSDAFLGAAEHGHSHCLSALQESCAPFMSVADLANAGNERGATALMLAAKSGKVDCVKILLQHNPHTQVTAINKKGVTALMMAAFGGHAECVSLLLQHNPEAQVAAAAVERRMTALVAAASAGHAGCVRLLLHHAPAAQVAAADGKGNTALILAAHGGHAECVEQLLHHGPEAQVLATGSGGRTALARAVASNHPSCMALLLAHSPSAQIAVLDRHRQSVVEVAARLGQAVCLDLLLAHDPQPQHLDAAWLAALQQWDAAAQARPSPHAQCLERLLAKGALLPRNAPEADEAKNRVFIQDVGTRALVADRANEAIVGLALNARGKKRKADEL